MNNYIVINAFKYTKMSRGLKVYVSTKVTHTTLHTQFFRV